MLTPVPIKDIPLLNHPSERLNEIDLLFNESESAREDAKTAPSLEGALALGSLTKDPILVTLGDVTASGVDAKLIIYKLKTYYQKLIFFREGSVYKVQADHFHTDFAAQVHPDISSLFCLKRDNISTSHIQAYKKRKDERTIDLDDSNITLYLERELQQNQGFFALPMSNLTYHEVKENQYLTYLANRFTEIYIIGTGDPWLSTHVVLLA